MNINLDLYFHILGAILFFVGGGFSLFFFCDNYGKKHLRYLIIMFLCLGLSAVCFSVDLEEEKDLEYYFFRCIDGNMYNTDESNLIEIQNKCLEVAKSLNSKKEETNE